MPSFVLRILGVDRTRRRRGRTGIRLMLLKRLMLRYEVSAQEPRLDHMQNGNRDAALIRNRHGLDQWTNEGVSPASRCQKNVSFPSRLSCRLQHAMALDFPPFVFDWSPEMVNHTAQDSIPSEN